MTTSPATAPEQNPSTLGLPRSAYSSMAQVNEATAVASVVLMNAFAAIPSGAKSIAVIFAAGFQTPFIQPSIPHTMWAIGKYTANIQTPTNTSTAANFILSATAPMIKAGVMMANISWYMANTFCETQYE